MTNIVSALPSKRIYRSIMQDYDLLTAICELIDNVIDNGKNNGKEKVEININFDNRKSTIIISDNSGGVENLEYVIAPGKTGNSGEEEVIGIFGVGSKRAAIALASHIKFRTFFDRPLYIQYDDDWLKDEKKWELDLIDDNNDLTKGTTQIELSKLRIEISDDIITNLKKELSFIYGNFLINSSLKLIINGENIKGTILNNWGKYNENEPVMIEYSFNVDAKNILKLKIIAGIKTATSSSGEYGVYFYGNNRLIAKEIKDKEVGYYSGNAGLPHPYASLGQFIINFEGSSNIIPWNSSKTGIVYSHEVYKQIRNFIEKLVGEYTKLSRKIVSTKDIDSIKKFSGSIKESNVKDLKNSTIKTYLPIVPKIVKTITLKENNKSIINKKPWCEGLVDSFIAIDKITKLNLVQKNRIAFIILDSNFEIGLKEYLVHELKEGISKITDPRNQIISFIKSKNITNTILCDLLDETNYYYTIRNNIVHQRATPNISDNEVLKYSTLIKGIFKELFGLKF